MFTDRIDEEWRRNEKRIAGVSGCVGPTQRNYRLRKARPASAERIERALRLLGLEHLIVHGPAEPDPTRGEVEA